MSGPNINSVFYAESYHPIQAGSIDGTDILPHDNAVYRAHLCSSAGLYEPLGDPNLAGDPYCTLFVSHLSHLTTEDTLRKAMSKYGRVKNLRLVRHIVTGASRGYAFVEFESEREMRRAYKDAHHSMIDDYEIIVDYNRQQLMPGWIPRRLGGGLGGKKESGQLRFGGRERPFRAPLRAIPFDDLKRLGIPPPPEGRYMSRFEVPSPPRRSSVERGERHVRKRYIEMEENSQGKSSLERGDRSSMDREERRHRKRSREREEHRHRRRSRNKDELSRDRSNRDEEESSHKKDREEHHRNVSSRDKEENSRKRRSRDEEEYSRQRGGEERPYQRQRHSSKFHRHEKKSSS